MISSDEFREMRIALGYKSQKEMSERIGIAKSVLSAVEKGDREPSKAIIEFLINEHSINANWLFSGQGSMFFDSVQNAQNQNEASEPGKIYSVQNEPNQNEVSEPGGIYSAQNGPNQNHLPDEIDPEKLERDRKELFESVGNAAEQVSLILEVMKMKGMLKENGVESSEQESNPVCRIIKKLTYDRQQKVAHYAEGLLHEQMIEAEDRGNRTAG